MSPRPPSRKPRPPRRARRRPHHRRPLPGPQDPLLRRPADPPHERPRSRGGFQPPGHGRAGNMPSTSSPAPARWAWKPSAARRRSDLRRTTPSHGQGPRPLCRRVGRRRRDGDRRCQHLPLVSPSAAVTRCAWLVFCSPPYDFYVDRREEMLELIGGVLAAAPPESLFVVECDVQVRPGATARAGSLGHPRLPAGGGGNIRKGGGRKAEGRRRQRLGAGG